METDVSDVNAISEAISLLEYQTYDAVFVDYQMPGEDGLSGIARLQEECPGVAIIMITGHGDERVASEAIKSGAVDYLKKGQFNSEEVLGILCRSVEKSRLEAKIREKQEALENFSKILVHDISAPLRYIVSFSELLEEAVEKGETEIVAKYSVQIKEAVERVGLLIDMLSDYNQIDVKPIGFDAVSLNAVLRDSVKNLSVLIENAGAAISRDDLPIVIGNHAMLMQLMQNLIQNAIKFQGKEAPIIIISVSDADRMWEVSVKDNGIGIPRIESNSIFEPFKRLHGQSEYPGSGLGLSVCKRIVERHGGEIRCESEPGEGSTFIFTLPKPGTFDELDLDS